MLVTLIPHSGNIGVESYSEFQDKLSLAIITHINYLFTHELIGANWILPSGW